MRRRESATKRACGQLKAAIFGGEFPAGRLDIQRLADRLRVSLTPVREALARLAAERLVEFGSRGFLLLAPSADVLRDLYHWSRELLRLSLDGVRQPAFLDPSRLERLSWRIGGETEEVQYARDACALFYEIAAAQPSGQIAEQLAQANDRLFRADMRAPRASRRQRGAVRVDHALAQFRNSAASGKSSILSCRADRRRDSDRR